MASPVVRGAQNGTRIFDFMRRVRPPLLVFFGVGVLAGLIGLFGLRIDMSFRPLFTSDHAEVERTQAFQSHFGKAGFNDLVAIVDVPGSDRPVALAAVGELADELRALPRVIGVRDPLSLPYFDDSGRPHPAGIAAELRAARSAQEQQAIVDAAEHSPVAQRLIFGDGGRRVAVTAQYDLDTSDFRQWRLADKEFRDVVQRWSERHDTAAMVTGYPDVEQVYAHEVLTSVLFGIGLLILTMVTVLFIYFRRLRDVVVCLAGVTLGTPIVLGAMQLLGQPFSIVNSQVLTLVVIVGIAEALHHQQEYRRRREAGRDHASANREAFSILVWPAFMTGAATAAGFAALLTADMEAIWSFGLCTSVGVILVYLVNWIAVPVLIDVFYRNSPPPAAMPRRSWTLGVLMWGNGVVQRRPVAVITLFVATTAALGVVGIGQLSVDQRVNEELPASHPSVVAQSTYEHEFAGFLGPDIWIRPASQTLVGQEERLARLVNRLCDVPQVRLVASPLDLVPQPAAEAGAESVGCHRNSGDLYLALAARSGRAGPQLQRLAESLIDASGSQAAVLIRVGDLGTAKSIPFAHQVVEIARQEMPDAQIDAVGQWWLAQQGMRTLSMEMMLSAVTALLLILPIMWFAIRDIRLFVAAILPTVFPVIAALGFMGLTGITVRIGTAMILAISLGLAADDTIHLSVRIRDRILAGSDPASAVTAVLQRTGRPAVFSSIVLILGFATMTVSSLIALQEMGILAAVTMSFALLTDVLLGPAIYLVLARRGQTSRHSRPAEPTAASDLHMTTAP